MPVIALPNSPAEIKLSCQVPFSVTSPLLTRKCRESFRPVLETFAFFKGAIVLSGLNMCS